MEYSWVEVKDYLKQFLENSKEIIDNETVEAINNYIQHDEYELAFEGLFIELMRNGKKVDIDLKEAMQLGRFLNLDKESVLDYFFWSKFLKYLSKSW